MAKKAPSRGGKPSLSVKAKRLWILLGAAAAIAAIIGGLALLRHLRREARFEENRREGLRLLAEGDPEKALEFLGRVVNRQPPDPEVLLAFARAREAVPLEEGRHLMPAIQARLRLEEISPDDLERSIELMRLFARAGLSTEADLQAERILARDPDNAEALRIRVEIASIRGRSEDAQRFAARLLQRPDATFEELRTRAMAQFRESRDIDELLREMRRWALPAPLEAARRALIADVLYRTGRPEQGASELDATIALRPRDPGTIELVVDLLDRSGDRARGDSLLEESISRSMDRPRTAEFAISRQWRANRIALAREELDKAEAAFDRNDPRWARWRLRLAALDPADPKAAAAARLLEERSEGELGELRADRGWARAVVAAGDEKLSAAERRSRLDEGLVRAPGDTTLLMLRGRQKLAAGDAAGAIPDLREAFDREGRSWATAGLMLAVAYEDSGSPAEAVRVASDLLGRYSDQLAVVIAFASVWANLEAQGRPIESLDLATRPTIPLAEFLVETLERAGDEPRVALLLAEFGARRGDSALVERGLAMAMRPIRLPAPLLVRFATIAVESGSPSAELLVERLAAQAPEIPAGLRLRGELLAKAGRSGEAFDLLRSGLARPAFPELDDAVRASILAEFAQRHRLEGAESLAEERDRLLAGAEGVQAARSLLAMPTTWGDEGRARGAIDRLSAALGASHPEVVRAEARWVARFRASETLRRDASLAALWRILDRGVEDREAALLIVGLEAAAPTPDLPRIERALRRMIELAPDNLAPYPDLARTLLETGRPELAAVVAKEYLDRSGDDLLRRREAASLLRASGDLGNALAAFEAIARQSDLDDDWIAAAQILSESGRSGEAGAILLRRADRDEASLAAVLEAATWLARERRADEGWQRLASRAERDPQIDLAVAALRFWMLADRPESADAAAEALRSTQRTDPPAAVAVADWLESRNRLDEAVALVGARLEEQPDAMLLLNWAAERFAHPGWDRVSGGALRARLSEQAPVLAELAALLRDATSEDGSLRPTAAQLDRAMALVESRPRDERTWNLAIRLHLAAQRPPQAAELARRAVASLPRNSGLRLLKARTELAAGSPADAIATVAELRPNESIDRLELDLIEAEAALALRDPERTLRLLAAVRREGGRRLDRARGLLATAELRAGRPAAAAELLRGEPASLFALAMENLADLPAASSRAVLAQLEPLLAQEPGAVAPLAAQLLLQHQNFDDPLSLTLAGELLARPGLPDLPQTRILRGDLAGAREQRREAIDLYREVIDAVPAEARRRLAAWASLPPQEQAATAGERVLLGSALNNMSYQMTKLPSPGREALAAVEEALVLLPGIPAIRDTRVKVLVALREVDAARAEAEALTVAAPDDAEFRLTLAQVLRAAGAIPEARREVTVAYGILERTPGRFPRIRRELEQLERSLGAAGSSAPGITSPRR